MKKNHVRIIGIDKSGISLYKLTFNYRSYLLLNIVTDTTFRFQFSVKNHKVSSAQNSFGKTSCWLAKSILQKYLLLCELIPKTFNSLCIVMMCNDKLYVLSLNDFNRQNIQFEFSPT